MPAIFASVACRRGSDGVYCKSCRLCKRTTGKDLEGTESNTTFRRPYCNLVARNESTTMIHHQDDCTISLETFKTLMFSCFLDVLHCIYGIDPDFSYTLRVQVPPEKGFNPPKPPQPTPS